MYKLKKQKNTLEKVWKEGNIFKIYPGKIDKQKKKRNWKIKRKKKKNWEQILKKEIKLCGNRNKERKENAPPPAAKKKMG